MPGVRRRLRDVQKKVSGVLAGPRDPAAPPPEEPAPVPDEPAVAPDEHVHAPDEQESSAVTSTELEPAPPVALGTAATAQPTVVAVDEVAAAAVELARAAAVEVAGPAVGEHLGVEAEGEGVVTHSFATTEAAYVGWRWAVTVARASGAQAVTVDEVVLLPGSGALLAPAWVPWSERVQPGDLSPGDLHPPLPDDPRLVPSYADVDAEELPFALHRELGLDRARVLSRDGRLDAAERWFDGEAGPDTPMAKAAPGRCGDCGFLTPLAGALGRVFGACANAMAPDDGRVVALQHGCGAYSETVVVATESTYAGMAVEDDEFEVVPRDAAGPGAQGDVEPGEPGEPGVVEADGDEVVEVDGLLVPQESESQESESQESESQGSAAEDD